MKRLKAFFLLIIANFLCVEFLPEACNDLYDDKDNRNKKNNSNLSTVILSYFFEVKRPQIYLRCK